LHDFAAMFHETNFRSQPIRDLGLTIEGTRLAPVIERFQAELADCGIVRLQPNFYLSTDWGVVFGSVSIGIPFYLAHPELEALHAEHVGHIEGFNRADILRYLRHEMGHVVNYAYKLYEDEPWVKLFGAITQPYLEEYQPQPFSTHYVRHLPGWYAQKHPDEDWAETFGVWMTPGGGWRKQYAEWPGALAKLQYCDNKMTALRAVDPPVNVIELDEEVAQLPFTVEDYYRQTATPKSEFPPGLDGALRSVFEDLGEPEVSNESVTRMNAAELLMRLERPLMADVFRWTGHFPEHTRELIRYLAGRAEELQQVYPADRELEAIVGVTTLITSLAMTHVVRGGYTPQP
jgi:hypothetical protein